MANESTSLKGQTRSWQKKKKKKKNRTAGFAGFCMDDSRMYSAVPENEL